MDYHGSVYFCHSIPSRITNDDRIAVTEMLVTIKFQPTAAHSTIEQSAPQFALEILVQIELPRAITSSVDLIVETAKHKVMSARYS
jgi:hypothetical protein